jgi:hypothetical protein
MDREPIELKQADQNAIRWVIECQLEAFQRDDAEGAFAFATPSIQAQFETSEKFMAMVRTAYQPVYRPRSVLFGEIIMLEGTPAQKVLMMASDGELVTALYLMEKQPNNNWRIQGCFLIPVELAGQDFTP